MFNLSVVVPTYNSSRTIMPCLNSIRNQTSPCAEVLIVDRFSTDGTDKTAREFGARVIQARVNRSVARNIGARYSSASALLFLDSDMSVPRTLIEECENALDRYPALVIPEVSVGTGFWAECKSLERQLYRAGDLVEAARCFLKRAFFSLGGYDSHLESGEDWDLQNRARARGISFGRVQSQILHDEGNLTLTRSIMKKYTYGRTMRKYLRRNPNVGMRQVNPVLRVLAPSLRMLPSDPLHGTGFLILKTLEFTAAGIGLLRGGSKEDLPVTSVFEDELGRAHWNS